MWKWKSLSHVQLFATLWTFPGQNTGVGSLFLLQGISPTQGSNPGLLLCNQILYQLSHKGSPRILVKKSNTHKWFKKIQQYKIYAVKISPNQPSFLPEAATDNFFVFPFRIVLYVNIQLSISFLFNRWHMIHTVQDFVLSIKWRILELLLISTYYSLLSFFKKVASFAIAWVHFHVINQIPTKWTLRLFLVFYLKKYYSGHDFTWIFEFISEIIC